MTMLVGKSMRLFILTAQLGCLVHSGLGIMVGSGLTLTTCLVLTER